MIADSEAEVRLQRTTVAAKEIIALQRKEGGVLGEMAMRSDE